jgi:hypothetical protein
LLTGPDGSVKEDILIPNLVVESGLATIASRLIGTATNPMSHMEIGTGTATPAKANTALAAAAARVALTSATIVTTTSTGDSVQYVATFNPGVGTGAITEAGLFNASSAGAMLCRTVFNVVNKDTEDTLTITWKVIVS